MNTVSSVTIYMFIKLELFPLAVNSNCLPVFVPNMNAPTLIKYQEQMTRGHEAAAASESCGALKAAHFSCITFRDSVSASPLHKSLQFK